ICVGGWLNVSSLETGSLVAHAVVPTVDWTRASLTSNWNDDVDTLIYRLDADGQVWRVPRFVCLHVWFVIEMCDASVSALGGMVVCAVDASWHDQVRAVAAPVGLQWDSGRHHPAHRPAGTIENGLPVASHVHRADYRGQLLQARRSHRRRVGG